MIRDESDGGSAQSPSPKTKTEVARKELSKARAQAPATLKSLQSPSALPADLFEKPHLRTELKAVSLSVLKCHIRSLKTDTSDNGPSSFSSSGNDEPHLSPSFDCHHDKDLGNTQAVQEENQSELKNFDDTVPSKPPPRCLNTSFSLQHSHPLLLPFIGFSRMIVYWSKMNKHGAKTTKMIQILKKRISVDILLSSEILVF